MKKQKVNVGFKQYRQADLVQVAMHIVERMKANKTTFVSPTPTLESISDLASSFNNTLNKDEYPGKTGDLRNLRNQLEEGLATLGTYVNGIAKGDLAILEESGFPISKEPSPHGEIPAPITMGVDPISGGGFNIWATPPELDYNGVLFAYTPVTNTSTNPYNWTVRYSPTPSIDILTELTKGVQYKFAVAFAGSVQKLNWGVIGTMLFAN